MKRFDTHFLQIIGFLLSFFILQKAEAQENIDSLYDVATMRVYDNPDKSIAIAESILKKDSTNSALKIKIWLLMSNAYSSKRDYQKSLDYAIKTKEENKELNNPLLQLQILNKIAAQYHQLGVNDKAFQVLDEADLIAKSYPEPDSLHFIQGNNFAIRGFIYRDQLSCDIAIDYLNKSYSHYILAEDSERSLANRSVITYNKGNCFINLNQLDSARNSFLVSKNFAEKISAKSLQAFSLKGLAEVNTLEGQYNRALQNLEKADSLASNIGDLVLNRGIYKGFADNYLALNNWDKYQYFETKFEEIKVLTKQNERKTLNKLTQEYAEESLEKKSKTKWEFGLGISLCVLALILLIGWIISSELRFQTKLKQIKSKIKI